VTKAPAAVAMLTAGVALAIAGCGDGGSGGGYGSKGADTTTVAASPSGVNSSAIAVADNPKLGRIIVNAEGFTLYDFHKDRTGQSSCYAACAAAWPPLLADGSPRAENGANPSQLGTTQRKDGTMQVTYAGHPLYTYVADTKPGDVKGNDIDQFGAEWYALQPNGEEPEG